MSDVELNADEGVAAVLGLVLLATGGDVRVPLELVKNGLPPDSRVVFYWDDDEAVVGVRKNDWKPDAD